MPPSQQIQLFTIPLGRRRQYKFVANKRWLESVEAARQKKKRHDKKQAKRDRNIHLFFKCIFFKNQLNRKKIHSTTASPYISPNHRQAMIKIIRTRIPNLKEIQDLTLQNSSEATYAGMTNAGSLKKAEKTSKEIKERTSNLHEIMKITHRKTRNSRIWDHFKAKTAYLWHFAIPSRNPLQYQNRTFSTYVPKGRVGKFRTDSQIGAL